MEWTSSQTLALAANKCTQCHGLGLRLFGRKGVMTPCDCVLRSVFRICYRRFRDNIRKEKYLSHVTLEIHSGPNRRGTWGWKNEEYVVDFLNVSKRGLTKDEYQIFKFRFLLGADCGLCCRRLNLDRGNFFHEVYRIQTKLGHVYSELQPYALFPLSHYFEGTPRGRRAEVSTAFDGRVKPIRPPVVGPDPSRKVA